MKDRNYKALIPKLAHNLSLEAIDDNWSGIDTVLPILEKIKDLGCVVLIKFDGERTQEDDNGPYTILISGKPLGGEFIRTDTFSLEEGLAYTIVVFAESILKISFLERDQKKDNVPQTR